MINFVLKKFVKKLNSVSLSADERAVLRADFLARTGLRAVAPKPSLKSSFVLVPSKEPLNFDLRLVDECSGQTGKPCQEIEAEMQPIESGVTVKVHLNTPFTPKNFVVMKIAPSKKDPK